MSFELVLLLLCVRRTTNQRNKRNKRSDREKRTSGEIQGKVESYLEDTFGNKKKQRTETYHENKRKKQKTETYHWNKEQKGKTKDIVFFSSGRWKGSKEKKPTHSYSHSHSVVAFSNKAETILRICDRHPLFYELKQKLSELVVDKRTSQSCQKRRMKSISRPKKRIMNGWTMNRPMRKELEYAKSKVKNGERP